MNFDTSQNAALDYSNYSDGEWELIYEPKPRTLRTESTTRKIKRPGEVSMAKKVDSSNSADEEIRHYSRTSHKLFWLAAALILFSILAAVLAAIAGLYWLAVVSSWLFAVSMIVLLFWMKEIERERVFFKNT